MFNDRVEHTGPCTTYLTEEWNSKINKLCRQAHPDMFELVKLLKSLQATSDLKVIQLFDGGRQCLTVREFHILQYADAASHLIHLN